jgi:hypothetical protein
MIASSIKVCGPPLEKVELNPSSYRSGATSPRNAQESVEFDWFLFFPKRRLRPEFKVGNLKQGARVAAAKRLKISHSDSRGGRPDLAAIPARGPGRTSTRELFRSTTRSCAMMMVVVGWLFAFSFRFTLTTFDCFRDRYSISLPPWLRIANDGLPGLQSYSGSAPADMPLRNLDSVSRAKNDPSLSFFADP